MAFAMCDHPLGNIIEFHLPFVRFPTIRVSLGARMPLLALVSSEKDGRPCTQTRFESSVSRHKLQKDRLEIYECAPFDTFALLQQLGLSLVYLYQFLG